MTISHAKCYLPLIITPDTQLMICILQIKLDEPSGFYQLIQSLTNKEQCMTILYCNLIQHSVINAKTKVTIPFRYKKY